MATVKIKGVSYALGDVAFTDENIDLFDSLMSAGDGEVPDGMFKGMRRLLEESLVDGNGEEKAAEAMRNLRFNFSKGSDLKNALDALGQQLKGE